MDFFKHLKRPLKGRRYLPHIDGLRFIAIASVVLFHLCAYLEVKTGLLWQIDDFSRNVLMCLHTGAYGVQLFFIISGFILALPYFDNFAKTQQPGYLKNYYKRRLVRLEPPYIICMTIFFVILLLRSGSDAGALTQSYFASLFYLHQPLIGVNPINSVVWSLEAEVQFYVILPLIMWGLLKLPLWPRRLVLVAAVVGLPYAFYGLQSKIILLQDLQFFVMGILFAQEFAGISKAKVPAIGAIALLVGLSLPSWAVMNFRDDPFVIRQIATLGLALIFLGGCQSVSMRQLLSNRFVAVIGTMCYSIYLIHYNFIGFVGPWFLPSVPFAKDNMLLALLIFAVPVGLLVLLVSTAYYVVIERPFMSRSGWQAAKKGSDASQNLPHLGAHRSH